MVPFDELFSGEPHELTVGLGGTPFKVWYRPELVTSDTQSTLFDTDERGDDKVRLIWDDARSIQALDNLVTDWELSNPKTGKKVPCTMAGFRSVPIVVRYGVLGAIIRDLTPGEAPAGE